MGKKTVAKASLIERTKADALARSTARLAELAALIRRRMTEVVEGFYDVGEALREIVDRKLYGAAGHASLEAFVKAEGLMSFRQATKLVALVRKIPREAALSLGQEKAYALVSYADATPEDDSAAALAAPGATIGGKPVAHASVREIAAATRAVRAKRPATASERARSKDDAALAKGLRAALGEAGFGRAAVTVGRAEVRVTLTRAQAERLVRGR